MDTWFMYYQSHSATKFSVRTAPVTRSGGEIVIPSSGDWTEKGIVLSEGTGWDKRFYGMLSPCTVIKKNGTFFLYYIGASGDRGDGGPAYRALGVATSSDGINFTKYAGNPLFTYFPYDDDEEGTFSCGAFLEANGEIVLYWSALNSQGSPGTVTSDVRLSISSNGFDFADQGIVLSHADSGVWGYGDELFPVGTFREGNTYHVYYIAKGTGAWWDLGLAQGPARNNIAGNTQGVFNPSPRIIGGCDPMHLSLSKIALFIVMDYLGEARTALVSSPHALSGVIQNFPVIDDYTDTTYLDAEIEGPPPFEFENDYGMVVLNPKPSSSELDQLKKEGLNFIWVMGFSEAFVDLCSSKNINCIIGIAETAYGNSKGNVIGYNIKDEPFELGYTLEQIIQMAQDARALTDKPIGYNFAWYNLKNAFPTLNAYVDYTMFGVYPYRDTKFYSAELDESWEDIVNKVTVPLIGIPQAFETANWNYPQIPPQKDFWNPKPMGLSWYVWDGGGGLIKTDETIRKGIRLTADVPPWDNRPDLEDGSLVNTLVPMGITRLELKRTQLSGSYEFTFDAGRRVKWQSFDSTIPNRNIYFRDDFLDNLRQNWVIVGGTWVVSHYFLAGSGNVTWQNNRIRIGPITWQNQDILIKSYLSSGTQQHRFFLRADYQGYNVNSYIIGVSRTGVTVGFYRVANGSVLEEVYKACPVLGVGWKWFRLQIYTSGGNVTARVKWWLPQNTEPAWIASHTWAGIWRSSGCFSIGRHTASPGYENHYTNVLISRYEGIPSPPNCSLSFKFWPSYDGVNLGPQYSSITQLPPSRYAMIKASLARDNLLSGMPTLENMNVEYETKHQPILI